jgi:hypothetical protein
MNVQRRYVMIAASAAAMAVLADRLPGTQIVAWRPKHDELLARVLEALHQPQVVLPATDDDVVRSLLARVLDAPVHEIDSYASASISQLKQRIHGNIARDYANQKVRVVDGWWLSETEAGCLELLSAESA